MMFALLTEKCRKLSIHSTMCVIKYENYDHIYIYISIYISFQFFSFNLALVSSHVLEKNCCPEAVSFILNIVSITDNSVAVVSKPQKAL